MFTRLTGFGSNGVVHDTVGEVLPIGVWTDALNIRFTGVEMQKMLEPELFATAPDTDMVWMQTWADGLTTYLAAASGSKIWLYTDNGLTTGWIDASRDLGYSTDGYWDSFAWGDTCIFNNGIDPPQIYNANLAKFEDLPNWGLISTADDILNNNPPSNQVVVACVRLVPFKSYLVAVGVTEGGLYQPNKIWWSDTTNLAGYNGAPNWDYETPASLSGQIVIDPEGGAIQTAAVLNEQLIIYTDAGATAMLNVGGSLVMQFRRLFNKGAAGLHCVREFNNWHFCISQDQVYGHDGSSVQLLAKDRVEEEFFKRIGKGGRFGTGNVDWDGLQVVKNPDRKELIVNYNIYAVGIPTPRTCDVYACDAYENELIAQGLDYRVWAYNDVGSQEYPFATTRPESLGSPTLFSAWGDFISGATLQTNWNGNYPEAQNATLWSWYNDAKTYSPCWLDTELYITAGFNGVGGRIYAVTLPTNAYVAGSTSTRTLMFTGYDGNSDGEIELTRNAAARWVVYKNAVPDVTVYTRLYVNLQDSDIVGKKIRISVGNEATGLVNYDLELGIIGGQWWNLVLSEECTGEIINGEFISTINFKATVKSQDGSPILATGTGEFRVGTSQDPYTSFELVAPNDLFNSPRFLYALSGYTITCANISYGVTGLEANHTRILDLWDQNFTDYVDPDPDCIPP